MTDTKKSHQWDPCDLLREQIASKKPVHKPSLALAIILIDQIKQQRDDLAAELEKWVHLKRVEEGT